MPSKQKIKSTQTRALVWLHWGCSTGDLCLSAGLCCLLYCVCLCVQMFPGKQSCAILWVHNAAPRQVIYDHVYTESPFHRISHRVISGSAFTRHLSRDTHLQHFHIHLCVTLPSTRQLFWSTWRPPPPPHTPCNLEAREKDKQVFEW